MKHNKSHILFPGVAPNKLLLYSIAASCQYPVGSKISIIVLLSFLKQIVVLYPVSYCAALLELEHVIMHIQCCFDRLEKLHVVPPVFFFIVFALLPIIPV